MALFKNKLNDLVLKSARFTFKPVVTDSNENENILESKFGGKPFIDLLKHPWPICKCGKFMRFFFQINSDSFSTMLKLNENSFEGLLQFFYCSYDCDDFQPFSSSNVVRIINNSDFKIEQVPNAVKQLNLFPLKKIVTWKEELDYITSNELLENNNDIENDSNDIEYIDTMYPTARGEKLFGWPCWIQGVDYPLCLICKK